MADINPFASAALELYQDQVVEINTGETRTVLEFSDSSSYQKNVIRGKLVGALGDGLIVECVCAGKTHKILINCWSIKAISAVKNNKSLTDFYVDEFQKNYKR